MKNITLTLLIGFISLVASVSNANAAEISFRPVVELHSPVVKLSDVADILSERPSDRNLADIELFPAPAVGQFRYVQANEILDILSRRIFDFTKHEVSGASQIKLMRKYQKIRLPRPTAKQSTLTAAQLDAARDRVRQAIVRHLGQIHPAGVEAPWEIQFRLSAIQARAVANHPQAIVASGGTNPWVGGQQFEISAAPGSQQTAAAAVSNLRIAVTTHVQLPLSVVVATRVIASGQIIQPSDVTLQIGKKGAIRQAVHTVNDVIGKEARRSIPAGQTIKQSNLQVPVVIKRGDIVTVYSYSQGIRVRVVAVAQAKGEIGGSLMVKPTWSRDVKPFATRVTGNSDPLAVGQQVVEVVGGGIRTASALR